MKNLVKSYIQDTIKLSKSIILKSEITALNLNDYLTAKYGSSTISQNPYEWKYYLNLNGEYHPVDDLMYIKSKDTGQEIQLTKNSLIDNPLTYKELLNNENYKLDLINKYPHQELLIRGILNPVDLDTAINAKDHAILYYDKSLVEKRESNFIYDLQDEIDNISFRWNVRGYYLTDPFYIPSLYSLIYTRLPGIILSIRDKYSKSYQAHSFHVKNYLESHYNLGYIVDKIPEEVYLWLFKNIKYINSKLGKISTLHGIINHILKPLNVEGLTYIPKQTLQKDKNLFPLVEYLLDNLTEKESIFLKIPLKLLLEKETLKIDSGGLYGKDLLDKHYKYIEENNILLSHNDESSKILELNSNILESVLDINLFEGIIDNWVKAIYENNYNNKIIFIDPNNNNKYYLDQKECFILYLGCISKLFKLENPIFKTWNATYIVHDNIDLNYLVDGIPLDSNLDNMLSYLMSLINPMPLINNKDDLNQYLIYLFYGLTNAYLSIAQKSDIIDHGVSRYLLKRLFLPREINVDLEDRDIYRLIIDNNLPNIFTENYNHLDTIKNIINTCTGFNLDNLLNVKNYNKVLLNIVNNITSYSTQKISNESNSEFISNVSVNFLRLTDNLIPTFYPDTITNCLPKDSEPLLELKGSAFRLDLSAVSFLPSKIQFNCNQYDQILILDEVEVINYSLEYCNEIISYNLSICSSGNNITYSKCSVSNLLTNIECNKLNTLSPLECDSNINIFTPVECRDFKPISPTQCLLNNTLVVNSCINFIINSPVLCNSLSDYGFVDCTTYNFSSSLNCKRRELDYNVSCQFDDGNYEIESIILKPIQGTLVCRCD